MRKEYLSIIPITLLFAGCGLNPGKDITIKGLDLFGNPSQQSASGSTVNSVASTKGSTYVAPTGNNVSADVEGEYIVMRLDQEIDDVDKQIKTEVISSLREAIGKAQDSVDNNSDKWGNISFVFADGQVFPILKSNNYGVEDTRGYVGGYDYNGNPKIEVINNGVTARQLAKKYDEDGKFFDVFYIIDGVMYRISNDIDEVIDHAQLQETLRNLLRNKGETDMDLTTAEERTKVEELSEEELAKKKAEEEAALAELFGDLGMDGLFGGDDDLLGGDEPAADADAPDDAEAPAADADTDAAADATADANATADADAPADTDAATDAEPAAEELILPDLGDIEGLIDSNAPADTDAPADAADTTTG